MQFIEDFFKIGIRGCQIFIIIFALCLRPIIEHPFIFGFIMWLGVLLQCPTSSNKIRRKQLMKKHIQDSLILGIIIFAIIGSINYLYEKQQYEQFRQFTVVEESL